MGTDILEAVRKSKGVSQSALARKTKTFQANISSIEAGKTDPGISTLEQCLAPLGYSLIALPTKTPSVSQSALKIAEAISKGHYPKAFRLIIQLSDNLKGLSPELCLALSITPPSLTGDTKYDALIAATVEYHLTENNLPLPAWIQESNRKLAKREPIDKYETNLSHLTARTPKAFLRHNILIDKSELVSI
jgi:transcriptional regulator with XRE-family HTH domain